MMNSKIDVSKMHSILELQRLKGLYFYYLDHKDWAGWCNQFTSDAKLLVDQEDGTVETTEGIGNVIEYVKERLATIKSVHHGHTPLYEFESDLTASGIWAMSDIIYYSDETVLYGYGHYRERYRKDEGVWKFASVHLTRLKVDFLPR